MKTSLSKPVGGVGQKDLQLTVRVWGGGNTASRGAGKGGTRNAVGLQSQKCQKSGVPNDNKPKKKNQSPSREEKKGGRQTIRDRNPYTGPRIRPPPGSLGGKTRGKGFTDQPEGRGRVTA